MAVAHQRRGAPGDIADLAGCSIGLLLEYRELIDALMEYFEPAMLSLDTHIDFGDEASRFAATQRQGAALLPNVCEKTVPYDFMLQACDPLAPECRYSGAVQQQLRMDRKNRIKDECC